MKNISGYTTTTILVLLLLAFVGGGFVGKNVKAVPTSQPEATLIPYMSSNDGPRTFTGQQIWDAVNDYREAHGLDDLRLEDDLCNNLAQRYLDIKQGFDEGIAHAKFKEWAQNYVPAGYTISEDYAEGNYPKDVIEAWDGSPGHRLSLLDPKFKVGCSYAANGGAVIELGHK
jgi:uncharacterized protein YkwD